MPPPLAYAAPSNPWFSWSYVTDNFSTIASALQQHALLTVETVLLATAIAVPLAVLAYWVRPLAAPILGVSAVLYTIPSLALFALLTPVLGIGRNMVLVGLVLYALLMVIRNALTGLLAVPEDVRDAARGVGYGRWRQLVRVELPLALPGILTGIRLATVSTVALVTIGVLNGNGGLGQLIMAGFRNGFYRAEIATSTLLCVALALVLDLILAGVGRLAMPWARRAGR